MSKLIGPTYPLRNGVDGRIVTSDDPSVLMKSAVQQFLLSTPGARPMYPEWGAGLSDLYFRPNDDVTQRLAIKRIRNIEKFLPVVVDDIEFIEDVSDKSHLLAKIIFRVIGESDQQSIVPLSSDETDQVA